MRDARKAINLNRREFVAAERLGPAGEPSRSALFEAVGELLTAVPEAEGAKARGRWCGDRVRIIEPTTAPGFYATVDTEQGWRDLTAWVAEDLGLSFIPK